jgi:hypothetical protein
MLILPLTRADTVPQPQSRIIGKHRSSPHDPRERFIAACKAEHKRWHGGNKTYIAGAGDLMTEGSHPRYNRRVNSDSTTAASAISANLRQPPIAITLYQRPFKVIVTTGADLLAIRACLFLSHDPADSVVGFPVIVG